ncbi:MAG: hypothetical protein COB22_08790 [Cycloclasticus sp.]|nr:MAG: hypothetical protein COB22_08790 [Cycloclasticus sp.]
MGKFMKKADYHKSVCEALNLLPVSESTGTEPVLEIGLFSIMGTPSALDASLKNRAEECRALAGEMSKSGTSAKDIRQALNRIPFTYDEYLETLKLVPKIRGEYAKIHANSKILSDDFIPPNDVPILQNIHHIDLKEVTNRPELFGMMKDMSKKISDAAFSLSYLHPETVLKFVHDFAPHLYTPDPVGHLNYLAHLDPKFFEKILQVALPVRLQEEDRKRHTYVVGGTGSGKSELLKLMVHNYVTQPDYGATVIIDPHGDLVEEIAKWKEFTGSDQLIYVDPHLHKGSIPTINPLDATDTTAEEREVIAQQIVGVFEQLLKGSAGASLSVNMRTLLLPCLLVLMDDKKDCTLADLQTFLNDDHNSELVALGKKSKRKAIARFFQREFGDKLFTITKQSVRTKLQSLFNTGVFYEMVNGKSTINLKEAIEKKKTILFNLAKGVIGTEASEALGRLIIANLQGIAIRRQNIAPEKRTPVHLFVDECQNYIGESTITILEEARKYKLYLTLAQQIAGRGMSTEVRTVVLNNTNVKFAGRTAEDPRIAKLLGIELTDVQNLKVGDFYCKAGNSPTFLLQADTRVLGNTNAVAAKKWTTTLNSQKQYYRTIEAQLKDADQAIELV